MPGFREGVKPKIRDGVLWITLNKRNLRTSVTCCEFKRLLDIQRTGASALLGQNARFLAGGVTFRRGWVGQKTGLGFYSSVHSCCCNTETVQPGKWAIEKQIISALVFLFYWNAITKTQTIYITGTKGGFPGHGYATSDGCSICTWDGV